MSGPDTPLSEAALAELLGVHLAEMEARLEAWGGALLRGAPRNEAAPAIPVSEPLPGPAPAWRLTLLAEDEPAGSWAGWSNHQAVRLKPGGEVELRQVESTPGVSSAYRPAPGGRCCASGSRWAFQNARKGSSRCCA